MNAKDFETIAQVLADHRASQDSDYIDRKSLKLAHFEMDVLARRFAGIFSQTERQFNADRFLRMAQDSDTDTARIYAERREAT